MTLRKPILVLACLFVVLPIALTERCPSWEDVSPCTCDDEYWAVAIKCHGIDIEELARVASNLRGKNIYSITIEDSKFDFIPHDIFKGVKLSHFQIEKSSLVALTDTGEAFFGLEEYLEELRIFDCVFKDDFDWSVLRNLRKLRNLFIHGSLNLETIGTALRKASVPRLESFTFFRTNITFTDHAFESYKNITFLDLSYNKIKSVKRTMLPNPALELTTFIIGDNLIEQFPEDMFTYMPRLEFVYISYNKILVLDEKTFSPVWEQLTTFYTTGNALRCDCRMSWILEKKSPFQLAGECASPPGLKGKNLDKLESKDDMC